MNDQKMFSRRHMTAEAHIAAQHAREERVNRWLEVMATNEAERAKRTDAQQLALLDKRLGKGKGAKKERARLVARIEAKKAKKKARKKKAKG